jgi:hypothetical protein
MTNDYKDEITNDYKDEITNLTKVVRDLTYTIQGACELYVNTNKEQLSSKSIVDINIANKRLSGELERTQNALGQLNIINQSLSDDLETYRDANSEFYDNGYWNEKEDRVATLEEVLSLKKIKPKGKLKLKRPTIGIFKNSTDSVGKALTDKDIADISAPLDLHGLHLNENTPLENDLMTAVKDHLDELNNIEKSYHDKTLIDNISELSKYARRYLRRAGIKTIDELLTLNEQGLDDVKYLGVSTKREVKELLNSDSIGCYYLNKRR